ncbi:hypothetical protein ACSLV1_19715 [Pseudomonas aeruginosa]|uniref:hypothetical protein n=1 Tax=Pseudomonas aeruginosa TaxID=287 RepID=UPI00117A3196|nr:hypothetical protein [Pseudomonas mendocina]TRO25835.1 hypothetical protein EQ828_02800 [Pseudomonas mendocina]TRO26002.1 hypothetical protein EQ826_12650 [Pseudomonas mendocina]
MPFVPYFASALAEHFQKPERKRMLSSLVVTAAPEHWISLESAALLDTNRTRFGLDELLDHRPNVPRWLIAAERKKVDLWIEDQLNQEPPVSIEFKVIHNNKNAYQKIWEIRRDLTKAIPDVSCNNSIRRWGVVILVFSRFYDDQAGNYSYKQEFNSSDDLLRAFAAGLEDTDPWYEGAPQLELVNEPILLCDLASANYIDPTKGQSSVHLALVRVKQ